MIGPVLPWKERVFRLQLQFFFRIPGGINYCNVTPFLYRILSFRNIICNNFVPNGTHDRLVRLGKLGKGDLCKICDVVCLLEPLELQIISGHPKVTQKWLREVDPKVTQKWLESDFWVTFESLFGHFRVTFESLWGHFGVDLPESLLSHFRVSRNYLGVQGALAGKLHHNARYSTIAQHI